MGAEWLFSISPQRLRAALSWLGQHNPLYADILIDEQLLTDLEEQRVTGGLELDIPVSDTSATVPAQDARRNDATPDATADAVDGSDDEFEPRTSQEGSANTHAHGVPYVCPQHIQLQSIPRYLVMTSRRLSGWH